MSDFLSNLVARSLGIAEVVRPRVPSIFEPYRDDRGVGVTRQSLRSRLANTERYQTDILRNSEPVEPMRRTQSVESKGPEVINTVEPAPFLRPAARPDSSTPIGSAIQVATTTQGINSPPTSIVGDESDEPAPEVAANDRLASVRHTTGVMPAVDPPSFAQPLRDIEPKSTIGDVGSYEPLSGMQPVDQSELLRSAQPSLLSPAAMRRESPAVVRSTGTTSSGSQVDSSSAEMFGASKSTNQVTVERQSIGSSLNPPGATEQTMPRIIRPAADREPLLKAAPAHSPKSAELKPDLSSRQSQSGELPTLPEAALRSSVRPHTEARNVRAVLPDANASEPPIRITIGRVDVRAIFPEPPARRAQPLRSRPKVSLDDFLNKATTRGNE
jgi:hypothetical protein